MSKGFIVFNAVAFFIFIVMFLIAEANGPDIANYYRSNTVYGQVYTIFFIKAFSSIGILIQFYFVNKKLSE
ncbi:hypothetical protein [Haloplasma contractile]|uniref:Uncharacterized protein n=1 Tax=Haloplasma contractile SSD-17B TaxID=1033810 RepID=F7PWH4_9MOLU|nr:hypothetical protein [Haloplasma contractile]ERJ11894.1 hypothetical protein HLPCO_002134 [Haloplasma contractile SSD-17B]